MIQLKKRKYLAVLLIFGLLLSFGSMASAASVVPELVDPWTSGNAEFECAQIGAGTDFAYKIEPWDAGDPSGPYLSAGNTISITAYEDDGEYKTFDWESIYPVFAVIVKAGTKAYVYEYDGAYSDTGLYAPGSKGISHATFCFNQPEPELGTLTVNKVLEGTCQSVCYDNDSPFSFAIYDDKGVQVGDNHLVSVNGPFSIDLPVGIYRISEYIADDMEGVVNVTYDPSDTFVINDNQTTAIEITNAFNNGGGDPDPEDGTLIINKVLAGNDQPASDTVFTVTIGETTETITAGENSFSLAPGTYAIEETDSQGADSIDYSTQSAVIEENQTTTVTITNTFNTDNGGGDPDPENGTLLINKVLAGNNQPASDTVFTVAIGEATETITAGNNSFSLAPGTYAIAETNSQGADSIDYSTQSVVIEENQTTTVTITNTFNKENGGGDPQDGTLIVNKIVAGNDRPDGDTEFTITINGEEHIILAGANTFKLAPGTYTVIETRDRGASSVINRTQTVDLSEGETTTISITNIFNTSGGGGGGGDYTPPEKPEEPVTVTEPPVAAPPLVSDEVTNSPVEEVVTVTEETPAAAQPLPHTGGPVGILWGAGLCISGLGLMIRKRFK